MKKRFGVERCCCEKPGREAETETNSPIHRGRWILGQWNQPAGIADDLRGPTWGRVIVQIGADYEALAMSGAAWIPLTVPAGATILEARLQATPQYRDSAIAERGAFLGPGTPEYGALFANSDLAMGNSFPAADWWSGLQDPALLPRVATGISFDHVTETAAGAGDSTWQANDNILVDVTTWIQQRVSHPSYTLGDGVNFFWDYTDASFTPGTHPDPNDIFVTTGQFEEFILFGGGPTLYVRYLN